MISTRLSAFVAGLLLDTVIRKWIHGENDIALFSALFIINAMFAIAGCLK